MQKIKFYHRYIFCVSVIVLLISLSFLACNKDQEKNGSHIKFPLLASFDFEDGNAVNWDPKNPNNWKVMLEDDSYRYRLLSPGEQGAIRAPTSWSILKDYDLSSFKFQGIVRCHSEVENIHRDVVVIFNFQDTTHFYYVHFSAVSDDVHNIIGLVNGSDRIKINIEPSGESIPRLLDMEFHTFKVTFDEKTGEIKAYMDDNETPILFAVDKTLSHGSIGIGSFDDTASFDDIKVWGKKFLDQE